MWEMVNRHHEEQKLIARNVVGQLDLLWPLLDFHDLQETTADWLKATRPVLERGFLTSQYVAARFAKDYRRALFPTAEPLDVTVPNPLGAFTDLKVDPNLAVGFMISMKVTGPVHVAKLMPMDEVQAMRAGFSKSTGAATRLVLNGGRKMIRLLADVDELAVGVAGVSDEKSCDSCRFLSNPILKTEGAKRMDAVSVGHDFCTCSARLVY